MHRQSSKAGAWKAGAGLLLAALAGCASKTTPQQVYPEVLKEMGVEGCVVLGYGIDSDGLIHDEQVLYEKPDDSFEQAAELTVEQRLYDRSDYGRHFREALVWKLPPKKGLDQKAQAAEAARRPPGCDQAALDAFTPALPKPYPPAR
jgi:hypothetical protein